MNRSFHFIPGHQQRFLDRIPDLDADHIVLELEDGVAGKDKAVARSNIISWLGQNSAEGIWIRVNSPDSEHWAADRELLSRLSTLPGIVVPKVEGPEAVSELVGSLGGEAGSVRFIALLESFAALAKVSEIAAHPQVVGIGIGMEDLLSGTLHSQVSQEWLMNSIKAEMVLGARAAGIVAIDTISTEIRDVPRFREGCLRSRSHGFDGRFVIHPSQIGVANEVYGPDEELVAWATRIEALTGRDSTLGYQNIGGELISPPKVNKARAILEAIRKQTR